MGAFSVQIVAIGQGIDEDGVMQLLESCVVQDLASCYPLPSPEGLEELALLRNDLIFEIIHSPQAESPINDSPSYIDFR